MARTYTEPFSRLGLTATPSRVGGPYPKDTGAGASRTFTGAFSRLGLAGIAARVGGPYTGKNLSSQELKLVSDGIRVYVTEGPISEIELDVSEVLRPRVSEFSIAGQARIVSDSIRPRVADTIASLGKGSNLVKPASDTITPVLADSASVRVEIGASDVITPVVTEGSGLTTAAVRVVSDSIVPVVGEQIFLGATVGQRSLVVMDTVRPVVRESGIARTHGEVDAIHISSRPCGIIRITEA